MQKIKVIIELEVPDSATEEDINQWVDVQYGECNSMKKDNPCQSVYEVTHAYWEDD